MMSFIPCSANCVFQSEGQCTLQYTTVIGRVSVPRSECLHYIPRNAALRNVRWHAAPPQYSAPGPASNRSSCQNDPRAVWE